MTGDESGLLGLELALALALLLLPPAGDDVVLPRAAAGEEADADAESPVWERFIVQVDL